jgi:hypothetical protein
VQRLLLNGNEAVAHAALATGVRLGTGYPGTPSTEILETFGSIGGNARWAPNEKVAVEVALGAAFGNARAMATMKHVGLNVAADPLFTSTHTGVSGALVIVVADDPGMHSSQNEQDSRRYAAAAGAPMLEPSDSQEAYDYLFEAVQLSERFGTPVLLRLSTRICHSKSIVTTRSTLAAVAPRFERDIQGRVMIPAYARPAHERMRERLVRILAWNEASDLNVELPGREELGCFSPERPEGARGPELGHRHLGCLGRARARGGAGGADPQARCFVSSADRAPAGVCRRRETLRGDRGGRSGPRGGLPRGGDPGRGQGGDLSLRRAERGPRPAYPGGGQVGRVGASAGNSPPALQGLPAP